MTYLFAGRVNKTALGRSNQALVDEIQRQGHQVVLITKWPSGRATKPKDALFLARLIRKHKPRGVICPFGSSNICLSVGWVMRVPVRIVWYHTLRDQIGTPRSLKDVRKRFVYKLATKIIAVSNAAKQDLARNYHVPSSKVWVWWNSVPDPQLPLSHTREGFVCAARMHPSKGLDVLLDAASRLDEPVTVYGPGTEQVGGRGDVPWSEVLEAMSRARAVVVPSRAEAFGLVAIEAMSVATPVVASAVGGLVEIVNDGRDGFLVPPGDPDALAAALQRVNGNMGTSARKRFTTSFCTETVMPERAVAITRL